MRTCMAEKWGRSHHTRMWEPATGAAPATRPGGAYERPRAAWTSWARFPRGLPTETRFWDAPEGEAGSTRPHTGSGCWLCARPRSPHSHFPPGEPGLDVDESASCAKGAFGRGDLDLRNWTPQRREYGPPHRAHRKSKADVYLTFTDTGNVGIQASTNYSRAAKRRHFATTKLITFKMALRGKAGNVECTSCLCQLAGGEEKAST